MFATGATVGLAEWIIDDTCLVSFNSSESSSSSYAGLFLDNFENRIEGLFGKLYLVSPTKVFLKDFSFNGDDKSIFFYAGTLGEDGGYTKDAYPLLDEKGL